MNKLWLTLFGATLLTWALAARADGPIPLKVLYAGNPGSDREKDFTTFLGSHFAKVGTANYEKFTPEQARDYDVVILDWTSIYRRDKDGKITSDENGYSIPNSPTPPELPESYDRPTILIGQVAGTIGRQLRLKIDWRCLCLDDAAHGLVPSHAIFHTPLEVDLTYEDVPTPDNYFELADGKPIGKTTHVWRVQTKKFPEVDPGLVSNPDGFDDSPDAEVISPGINSKGPYSVALGRHANFFLWGFWGSPAVMTPEARKCFVNVVCYIKKFDGQKPIVRKTISGFARTGALSYAYYLRTVLDEDAFRRSLPEPMRNDSEKYQQDRKHVLRIFEEAYPEDVRKRLGTDPERYIAWVKENLEYFHPVGKDYDTHARVDEDVKSLGLSNRKVELLDKCIAMLEQGDRPELAQRVLRQYTTLDFPDAKGWRSWLDTNRARLFFTDVGGFKFVVAPESLVPMLKKWADAMNAPAELPKPSVNHPVVATARLEPAKIEPGGAFDLIVHVETAPTWHIYTLGSPSGPGIPTTLKLALSKGITTEGDWASPEMMRAPDGQRVHEGGFAFRRRLRVASDAASGPLDVICELGYQACDPWMCRPPEKVTLKAQAEVSKGESAR